MPARRAALTLLQAVLWQGRALEAALPRALRSLDDPSDRGLARNIAASVLRWLPDLDELIDARTRMPLPDDARARMVLRMALAQALVLETPHHAVVATALPLVEGGPRRLVHGVLSSALKAGDSLPDRPLLPEPWGQRWAEAWGEKAAAAAAAAMAAPPPIDLTYKSADVVPPPGEGEVSLLPGHLRTRRAGRVEAWDAYGEGDWWVQDLAAALPARLLAPQAGERIADLCAAPGGKTMQLAATGAAVIAVENNEKRLTLLRENLERTGLPAELLHSDARKFRPEAPLDAVLLDAPCSATGIFRRHPDVLHLRDPDRLEETLRIQAALLSHAATLVRPGGRMVYAVCSLEREEGEDQVDAFLDRHPDWHADPAPAGALPEGIREEAPGRIRTLPGDLAEIGGCDGFFMGRLVRDEN
ncbi:RsmB/NOP family class I SAM-dependent RNA methyltransferase [Pacificimonas flava]|uniref:RsmB/NOP family class I SAM-dependent RNA methyltransferase n=1 Tax=Pacificimonas flava TaxID=1234595 RepID=UPI001A9C80DE|nr:transcription antitermination factor NusB [Pacificimonas flava]